MKKVWKAIKIICVSLLALLAIILMWIFIQTKISPNKVPSLFGYKPFIVLSGSMESEIHTGDLVIVKNVDTNKLKKGDIIAFRDEDNYVVTHRIVDIVEDNGQKAFVTKGDNNNKEDDDNVSMESVEGKYVRKINGLGKVLLVLQKPVTLGIIIGFIIAGGVLWIVLDNNKLSKEERAELERLRKEKK